MDLIIEHWIVKEKMAGRLPDAVGRVVYQDPMGHVTAEFHLVDIKTAVCFDGLQVITPRIDMVLVDDKTGKERKTMKDIGRGAFSSKLAAATAKAVSEVSGELFALEWNAAMNGSSMICYRDGEAAWTVSGSNHDGSIEKLNAAIQEQFGYEDIAAYDRAYNSAAGKSDDA